jgi:hypothetical protein
MADPIQPGGGAPPSPPAPPNQPPVDPMMVAAFSEMATAAKATRDMVKEIRDMSKDAAGHAKDVTKSFDKEKLSFIVGLFDEVENKLAEINRFAKKFSHEVSNFKDTKAAKEQIEDMVKAMKDALASQKSFSAGAGAIRRNIAMWEKEVAKFGDEIRDLNASEMKDLVSLAERTAKAGKDFGTSMKASNLGKFGDFLKGATASTKPSYIADLKDRWSTIKDTYQAPSMARKMMAAGGEGAEGAAAGGMIEGAMNGVIDAIEGGVAALEVGIEALTGPLGWLIIAIEALIATFDKVVKQNKEMETKLGKGGLFTGNAMLDAYGGTTVGSEDAFARTRRALTPRGTGLNELGITFERNMGIAGALAGGGYGIKGMLEGPDYANQRPITTGIQGLTSGFAGGGFGQVQRTVTGVGRVLGMSDAEGVEEVLKMLEQYSQTLDSTEKFLVQIDKDTDAAGISTTKYLKIIDDVSSHFNSMNKEITQTLGIMRELGRSGAVSSEVLKDMMDFLTTEAKPDVGGIADDIYAQTQMSKGNRQAVIEAADAGVQAQLDVVGGQVQDMNKAAGGAGVGIQIPQINIGKGTKQDFDRVTAQINKLEVDTKDAVASKRITGPQGQMLDQAIQSLRESVGTAGVSRTDAFGRSAGRAAGFISPAGTAALQLSKMTSAAGQWGIKVSDIVENKAFEPGSDSNAAIGFLKQLSEIYHMDPAESRRRFAETMTERTTDLVSGGSPQARLDAQALTKEVFTKWRAKGILPNWAKERGYTLDGLDKINSSVDDNAKFLKDNQAEMMPELENTNGLMSQVVQAAAKQYSVSDTDLALELDKARKIGRQTQDMADMIGAVFSKWFTKIISWLEYIGNVLSKAFRLLPGVHSFEDDKAARQKTFTDMSKDMSADIGEIPQKLEEVQKAQLQLQQRNKGLGKDQWSKADQEQFKALGDIEDHLQHVSNILTPEVQQKYFGSQDEIDDSTQAMSEFTDQMKALKGITVDTASAVSGAAASAGAGTGSGVTHDDHSHTTYNVGQVHQYMKTNDSVGKSDDSPKPQMVPAPEYVPGP